MLGDIQIYDEGAFGYPGDEKFVVASGGVATINAGEPVLKALGANAVTIAATNEPVVGTQYMAGIAATTSTDTASANGVVNVTKMDPNLSYLIAPKVAITSQTTYDGYVGYRVLLDLTAGTWTILVSDSANNGCVIEPLDIKKYPGKVRFSLRQALSYRA